MTRQRRLIVLVLLAWVATGLPASGIGQKYAGRPLGDVLRELQAAGLNIVFSSEIVRPMMNVLAEPKAVLPRKILDEILRPHGLQVQSGPGGALLVVRVRDRHASQLLAARQFLVHTDDRSQQRELPIVGMVRKGPKVDALGDLRR